MNALQVAEDSDRKYGSISLNQKINIVQYKLTGDAVNIYPEALPEKMSANVPLMVFGDGNCLPRSGSVLAFGDAEHHLDIRCRFILELVKHSELYINVMHIDKVPQKEIDNLCKTYVMFSGVFHCW